MSLRDKYINFIKKYKRIALRIPNIYAYLTISVSLIFSILGYEIPALMVLLLLFISIPIYWTLMAGLLVKDDVGNYVDSSIIAFITFVFAFDSIVNKFTLLDKVIWLKFIFGAFVIIYMFYEIYSTYKEYKSIKSEIPLGFD